jgi:hypothetical protein
VTRPLVVASVVGSAALTLAALASSFGLPNPDWGLRAFATVIETAFTTVGAVLAWQRPRNAVSWLLLGVGFSGATLIFATEYALFGYAGRAMPLAGATFAAWLASWIWLPQNTLIAVVLPLIFPNGHFLSARWRAFGWLGGISAAIGALGLAFLAGPLNNATFANNPYPLFDDDRPFYAGLAGVAVAGLGAAASLVVRYRRSRGAERQQLKWLALAAVILAFATVVAFFYHGDTWAMVLNVGAITLAPITVGIAVLRYRLYDIDVLINRALVYGATTAAIAAAFFGGIVVLQPALRPITGGSELAVAASTLASVALFQPLRSRVQRAVDRRFYRSHYDASRMLDAFSVRLRDEVDLDAVRSDLLGAVRDTMRPTHASVWLRRS